MSLRGTRKLYMITGGALVLAWALFVLIANMVLNGQDRGARGCFTASYQAPAPAGTQPSIDLGQTSEKLNLSFGMGRSTASDEAQIETKGSPPSPLQVESTGLRGNATTIDGSDVRVRARVLRGTLLLDACLDLRRVGRVVPGRYQGKVVFTDPRVSELTIPITATIQSRILIGLAPFILVMPLLGLFLVWESVSTEDRANFGKGALAAAVTAIGATAVVYGAQGLSNGGWGGIVPAAALVGGMYTAAIGVTATFIAKAKRENPSAPGAAPVGEPPVVLPEPNPSSV